MNTRQNELTNCQLFLDNNYPNQYILQPSAGTEGFDLFLKGVDYLYLKTYLDLNDVKYDLPVYQYLYQYNS